VRRGVTLDSLEALIHGRATPRRWRTFVEAAKLSVLPDAGQTKGGASYSAYFYALPSEREDDRYFYGDLRPAPGDPSSGQLRLRWELKPEGPIPPRIKRSSDEVGGWPEVLQRIAESWPGGEAVTANVTAVFVLDTKIQALRAKLALKTSPTQGSGHQLTQTAVAWTVEPPSGVVRQLSVARLRDDKLAVVASGQASSTLGPDMGAKLEAALLEGIKPFLVAP